MRKMMALVLCLAIFTTSCSHPLTFTNLSLYKANFIDSAMGKISVGINATTSNPEEERLVTAIANSFKRDGLNVKFPYYANNTSGQPVDYQVKIATTSEFKGSGINFLINWPGFLIWAPALFGYSYTAKFNFDIDIIDVQKGTAFPRLTIPVELQFKHAAMNRTWTEISWLEVSVIAFIGGICFINYDHSVTPQVMDSIENKIGDYVSSKIASTVIAATAQPAATAATSTTPVSSPAAAPEK